jgi:hypothetical protein
MKLTGILLLTALLVLGSGFCRHNSPMGNESRYYLPLPLFGSYHLNWLVWYSAIFSANSDIFELLPLPLPLFVSYYHYLIELTF